MLHVAELELKWQVLWSFCIQKISVSEVFHFIWKLPQSLCAVSSEQWSRALILAMTQRGKFSILYLGIFPAQHFSWCTLYINSISRVTIYSLDVLLFLFGTSLFSMSSSNYCFLTCIQISQETGQVVWYSHLFWNFPQFIVIHTVKGFGIVNNVETDIFWNCLAFLMIQQMLALWSLVPLPFLNQLNHLEVHSSCTAEVWLGEFWALFY